MKSRLLARSPILIVSFFLFIFSATEKGNAQPPVDNESCSSFIAFYCTTCHNTQRICASLATQDEEAWKKIIHTMAEYGDMNNADEKYTLSCMHFMEPGSEIVCKQK
ncbi:MAG: hypothetical protein H8E41_02065 [Desulfobulbaceae bacterium]|uniref:Cytochrome c n=1 Tax=Candidatus Desulfobia pelagia TaxID=2841692 RepID=A0A8J6N9W3_9BACT|nr:hypothetical protein [Candidatus Desulfobia pelagia]